MQILRFEVSRHDFLVEPLTELLHTSYAPLLERGMRYLATHQTPEVTRKRLLEGESYLGIKDDQLIATVTLKSRREVCRTRWYTQSGIFHFGQFAVHPDFQGQGIGSRLMDMLEGRARDLGATELALDTSEHAEDLIYMYTKRGYRRVETVQWEETNYRSVILSKTL